MRIDHQPTPSTPFQPSRPLTPPSDGFGDKRLDKVSDTLAVRSLFKDTRLAVRLASRFGPAVREAAPEAMEGLSKAGKWAPAVSVPFAGYDVAKAVKEADPTKKRAAWANAALTVGGTAMGLRAAVAAGGRLPLVVGSAAIAGLQLADAYLLKGRVTQWLGDTVTTAWQEARASRVQP
jgi:hypothetical protein